MVVRAAQDRQSESPQLCLNLCCIYILRIFIVQCGSESTSEWPSLGEIKAMNETKKLGADLDLASDPHSRRFRENTPGYTRIQYRHQQALWTCSLYITKATKTCPGRTSRVGLHPAVDPFSRWRKCSEVWIDEGSCLSR